MQALFLACVTTRCNEPCMGTQAAIDQLGGANGQDRTRLLTWLASISRADLHDALMVAWARLPLTLATGRSREEWLSLFNNHPEVHS